MKDTEPATPSPVGRPRKADGPRVPYNEVDRLLVFGEVIAADDGEPGDVRFPSYREVAARYGVSHSVIAQYSKRHDCLRRRENARARITARVEQKLVELRASALAYSRDDELRLIDTFLLGFEQALAEGRVRYDDPSDFNLMVRLKTFIQGGADSRQEVRAALSLDDLQARHREIMRGRVDLDPALTGMVPASRPQTARDADRKAPDNPPAPASADRPAEVTGHPPDGGAG